MWPYAPIMAQGDEYRNALSAAQQRVDRLERELQEARAAMPAPPRGTPMWVAMLASLGGLGVGLFALGIGAMVVSSMASRSHGDEDSHYEPAQVAPSKPSLGASWYTGRNEGPQVQVDVDGDGDKDVVSLFWRAPEDRALYVAAVDRDTLQPLWTAGPYPSQWSGPHTHLVVTATHVVVSDSRENVHVLDVKTGAAVHDLAFAGGARSACQLAATPGLIRLDRSYGEYEVLDPTAGTFTVRKEAGVRAACIDEHPDCNHAPAGQACYVDDPGAVARSKVKGLSAYGSTVLGDLRFTEGSVATDDGKHSAPWLMMSDAKGKKMRWTSPAVLDGDTVHIAGGARTELTAEAVVTSYQRSTGDFRMLARSTETGELLWSQIIAGTTEGSFAELFVQDGEIFVNADHRMHVYDLRSGAERQVSTGI